MRTLRFGIAWTFIFLAAGYDAYFAWQYRAVFEAWELNPLVLWIVREFSLGAVFAFKFGALAFALALATYCHCRRHRLEKALTVVIGSAYVLLSVHYLVGQLQPDGTHPTPAKTLAVSSPAPPAALLADSSP